MRRSPRKFLNHTGGLALIEFALIFPFLFVLLFAGIEVVRWIYIQQKLEKAGHVVSDVVARYMPAGVAPAGSPPGTVVAGQISVDEIVYNVFPIPARVMGTSSTGGVGGFSPPENQSIIITSVSHNNTGNVINWQIGAPGRFGIAANDYNQLAGCDLMQPVNCVKSVVNGLGVTQINPSVRGTVAGFNGDPFTPTGKNTKDQIAQFPLRDGENMIISEIFYKYTPLLTLFAEETHLENVTHISVILKPKIYAKRTFFTPRNGDLTALPPAYPVIP